MGHPKYSWREVHTATGMETSKLVTYQPEDPQESVRRNISHAGLRTLTREDFTMRWQSISCH